MDDLPSGALGELLVGSNNRDRPAPSAGAGRRVGERLHTADHRRQRPRNPRRHDLRDARLRSEDAVRGRSRCCHLRVRRADAHPESRNVVGCEIHDGAGRGGSGNRAGAGRDHGGSCPHGAFHLRAGADVERHFSQLPRMTIGFGRISELLPPEATSSGYQIIHTPRANRPKFYQQHAVRLRLDLLRHADRQLLSLTRFFADHINHGG